MNAEKIQWTAPLSDKPGVTPKKFKRELRKLFPRLKWTREPDSIYGLGSPLGAVFDFEAKPPIFGVCAMAGCQCYELEDGKEVWEVFVSAWEGVEYSEPILAKRKGTNWRKALRRCAEKFRSESTKDLARGMAALNEDK